MDRQITWLQATEIIGISPRSMRLWKRRYEKYGYDGPYNLRLKRPSPKRVPMRKVKRVLELYRDQYHDFNVKHFVEKLHTEHGWSHEIVVRTQRNLRRAEGPVYTPT